MKNEQDFSPQLLLRLSWLTSSNDESNLDSVSIDPPPALHNRRLMDQVSQSLQAEGITNSCGSNLYIHNLAL